MDWEKDSPKSIIFGKNVKIITRQAFWENLSGGAMVLFADPGARLFIKPGHPGLDPFAGFGGDGEDFQVGIAH